MPDADGSMTLEEFKRLLENMSAVTAEGETEELSSSEIPIILPVFIKFPDFGPENIDIINGSGSTTLRRKPAFGKEYTGYFEIQGPKDSNYTWDIKVFDLWNKQQMASTDGAKCGDKIAFDYKAGFGMRIKIDAKCSEDKANTTLTLMLRDLESH